MATILLFHSVLGLREVERAAADRLRQAGHAVVAPDLFDGATAEGYDEGFAILDRLGMPAVLASAEAAAAALPPEAVLAGLSMGGGVAAHLWARRPEAAGVLLLHGIAEAPPTPRPMLPVQVHLAEPDPFEDETFVVDWAGAAARAGIALEIFRYPGAGHLFTDPSLPDHHADAAALVWRRVAAFLDAL